MAYGVVTLLVNLTNSYEKQEIMPELIELAKFAKHHIPQEHELDDQDFIDKRIWVRNMTYLISQMFLKLSGYSAVLIYINKFPDPGSMGSCFGLGCSG